ncbi:DUF3800 domain-containing protein [Ottowia thiooxydans]|uniref:DUF3800 domain-containing protein n=1 Tax=Ottowia thiooxydans TaxID=219182 RepID=A0ABV2QEH7_9BURK
MTTIYCDEAGNSGANLLDPEQPCFVLASNDFSREEAESLLEHVRSAQGAEPKFTGLRKSGNGVARLIRFLADPRLSNERVVVDVFHKKFMVTTKLVDIVAETVAHEFGPDLYECGANLAMSNMLHYCMPVFCGQENTDRFLAAFVELIRRKGPTEVDNFYAAGDAMIKACTSDDFKGDLFPFVERRLFDIWFGGYLDSLALDPAIPALFQHIAAWGSRKEDRFHVVHDASKPILASQATFQDMLALTGEGSNLIGYDRRKMRFPLRALTLTQADSTLHPQLQVADLCAGITNHLHRCWIADNFDELATATRDLGRVDWTFNGVVPSPDVTPEALGTAEGEGTNAVDAIAEHLWQRRQF